MKSQYIRCDYFKLMFDICIKNKDKDCDEYFKKSKQNYCSMFWLYIKKKWNL